MPRLFDFYASVFSFGLALDAPFLGDTAAPTGGEAQQRARRLLDRARASALAAGHPASRVESASFAVVAWFDEILARHAHWADSAAPLQLQLFNSNNARIEFFHHLSALPAQESELREIYWYALALGFKGQYYFETDSAHGELAKLLALHAPQLPVQPLDEAALREQPLTPQPYTQHALEPAAHEQLWRARGRRLRIAAACLLLIPTGWLLASALGAGRPAPPGLAERLEHQLQSYACADLVSTVDAGGHARVRGFVPQQEDAALIRDDVRQLPGVTGTDVDLQMRPWPYCEVVTVLKPYQARNAQAPGGVHIDAPSVRDGILREGDPVRVVVKAPSQEAQLWVDFYTADGAVMHFGTQGARVVRTRPGQILHFGNDIPSSWLVSPPFGTVLVAAMARARNEIAVGAEPPPYELASAYLPRLREMLAADRSGGGTVADFVFLRTGER